MAEEISLPGNKETGRKKILAGCLTVMVQLIAVWVVFNPPGQFGYHRFGLIIL